MTEAQVQDLLIHLRDGSWLDGQVFPPLTYAVPGILPEGSTLLVGPPKIGKSWFVLSCALAVASGGRALGGLVVDDRPVLYLALEDGHRRLQDRCRTLLGDDPIPSGFEYLTTVIPGLVAPTIGQWLQRYDGTAPLVILDTLGKVMPPALSGESAYQRDYRIGSTLKRLTDEYPGSALLTNHHDRKADADDFVDSYPARTVWPVPPTRSSRSPGGGMKPAGSSKLPVATFPKANTPSPSVTVPCGPSTAPT